MESSKVGVSLCGDCARYASREGAVIARWDIIGDDEPVTWCHVNGCGARACVAGVVKASWWNGADPFGVHLAAILPRSGAADALRRRLDRKSKAGASHE